MAATTTTNLGLSKPAALDHPGWGALLNANWDRIDGLAGTVGQFAVRATAIDPGTGQPADLRFTIAAGTVIRDDGATQALTAYGTTGNLAVPANATTYVWLDASYEVFTGSAFPATGEYLPLAAITTDGTKIVPNGIADKRSPMPFLRNPMTLYVPEDTSGSATHTVTSEDTGVLIDATASPVTVILPVAPLGLQGRILIVSKRDASANHVTIDANGKLIDGASTYTLTAQYQRVWLLNVGSSDWAVVGT